MTRVARVVASIGSWWELRTDATLRGLVTGDAELLGAWRCGDEAAGSALARRHFEPILQFFRTKAPSAAEDLTQETFLQLLRARDRIDEQASFRAYLFGIARHRLLHHFRDSGRAREKLDAHGAEPQTPPYSPSGEVRRDERRERLLGAMAHLDLDLRLALELTYWHGLSTTEVAAVIEVPSGTIKSRLRRAREQLRQHLHAQGLSQQDSETTLMQLVRPQADE